MIALFRRTWGKPQNMGINPGAEANRRPGSRHRSPLEMGPQRGFPHSLALSESSLKALTLSLA